MYCPVAHHTIARWQYRLRTALDNIKRRDVTQRHLWPLVNGDGEWKVEVLDGREDPFYVTEYGMPPCYSDHIYSDPNRRVYYRKNLKIIGAPAQYWHLL